MSTKFVALLAAALLLGSTAAQAETTPGAAPKIAILNIQEIMRDSTAAKSVRAQLETKQKSFQSEMSKKEEELRKEDQELSKERAVLSPDAFEKKLREFKDRATGAQKDVQAKKAQLDKGFGQALNDIQKAVYDIVSKMAKERGYTVVIPTSQLLYAEPSLDISKEVLAKLNSDLPKVSIKF